ncbi:MAG: hypothetical protein ACREIF_05320 [Chthoniobacterales bacterium]
MLRGMRLLLPTFAVLLAGILSPAVARAQDSFAGIDLLYPELAHPDEDARAAIKQGDLRFIAVDRYGKDVPGVERYPRLKQIHGTKFVRQPFRILATPSENFSFNIRARAYAREYNRVILRFVLRQH